ncbi:hypothetical protein HanIR_Chr09g0420661 [Helianthus annuus]|nr:hypothetical protein HanIR_Chr09g0420661 [Helianthus annuus]
MSWLCPTKFVGVLSRDFRSYTQDITTLLKINWTPLNAPKYTSYVKNGPE